MTLSGISLPKHAVQPYHLWLDDAGGHVWYVFVKAYTGQVMSDRQWENSWVDSIYSLQYKLLAGDTGEWIMPLFAYTFDQHFT
ncbi:hypothetical protein [Nostoc sp.]|uniref:hypothetical protein n=1 Tax=Nostoc sp. TaxID=1180 RepID=UPI002FF50BC4